MSVLTLHVTAVRESLATLDAGVSAATSSVNAAATSCVTSSSADGLTPGGEAVKQLLGEVATRTDVISGDIRTIAAQVASLHSRPTDTNAEDLSSELATLVQLYNRLLTNVTKFGGEQIKAADVRQMALTLGGKQQDMQEAIRQISASLQDSKTMLSAELKNISEGVCNHTNAVTTGNTIAPTQFRRELPRDCADIQRAGGTECGVYKIVPTNSNCQFEVFCDFRTDGGGWTVFQHRVDGSVDFYRTWNDYKNGFGDINNEFWLGNDKINLLTSQDSYELRIDMEDTSGNTKYATYSAFSVASEEAKYSLSLGDYSGDAGDSFSSHNTMAFSTRDVDNDAAAGGCALRYKAGWWYGKCHTSNLNGLYLLGTHVSFADGINWQTWRGYNYSLKRTDMKIRPSNYRN